MKSWLPDASCTLNKFIRLPEHTILHAPQLQYFILIQEYSTWSSWNCFLSSIHISGAVTLFTAIITVVIVSSHPIFFISSNFKLNVPISKKNNTIVLLFYRLSASFCINQIHRCKKGRSNVAIEGITPLVIQHIIEAPKRFDFNTY